jgi:hypothetical protein
MITLHHTLAQPLQQQQRALDLHCSTPSLQPGLGTIWLLFPDLKKHFKGFHLTCDEVQAAMGKWFWEEPGILQWKVWNMCSERVAPYWIRGIPHGRVR